MTRKEHLDWCKKRALEYVDRNELTQAYASMISDLGKHPETMDHIGIQLGVASMMAGKLSTRVGMRKFIEGFG